MGQSGEYVNPEVATHFRRARNYLLGALTTGAVTGGLVYESLESFNSGNVVDAISGGGFALASIAGSIATAGCAHSALYHRREAWRINDELLEKWRSHEQ